MLESQLQIGTKDEIQLVESLPDMHKARDPEEHGCGGTRL